MSLEEHHRFILDCMDRRTDIARKLIQELEAKNAALAAENERLKAEVEWLRKADRLVCWNAKTQAWEVRHEAQK